MSTPCSPLPQLYQPHVQEGFQSSGKRWGNCLIESNISRYVRWCKLDSDEVPLRRIFSADVWLAALWGSLQVLKVDCASCELGVVRAIVVLRNHWRFLRGNTVTELSPRVRLTKYYRSHHPRVCSDVAAVGFSRVWKWNLFNSQTEKTLTKKCMLSSAEICVFL